MSLCHLPVPWHQPVSVGYAALRLSYHSFAIVTLAFTLITSRMLKKSLGDLFMSIIVLIMRGHDLHQDAMFSYLEQLPQDHPLRPYAA